VRVDGKRSVLMTILKSGSASTIDIVDNVKKLLTDLKPTCPMA
jgi:multidrug efflux pump subunit AcrB